MKPRIRHSYCYLNVSVLGDLEICRYELGRNIFRTFRRRQYILTVNMTPLSSHSHFLSLSLCLSVFLSLLSLCLPLLYLSPTLSLSVCLSLSFSFSSVCLSISLSASPLALFPSPVGWGAEQQQYLKCYVSFQF